MSDQRRLDEQRRPDTFRLAGFPVQASPTILLLFLLISFTTATNNSSFEP